jgi:DNA end-binding protein Ku
MYFANEIRQLPEYGVVESTNLKPQEVKLTEQLIESLTEPFKPKQYHNEFQEKLKKLIAAKRHGKTLEIGEQQPKRAPVIDMMTALKNSLAASASHSDEKQSRKSKWRKMPAAARRAS